MSEPDTVSVPLETFAEIFSKVHQLEQLQLQNMKILTALAETIEAVTEADIRSNWPNTSSPDEEDQQ